MLFEGIEVNKTLALLREEYSLEDLSVGILKDNIFGVDLNAESVEITKLSLWLKTAKKTDPLTSLDNNIRCGNSLIDDETIAGEKAFKWEVEFKEIMDNGGFDIVIGNPPYVRQELFKEQKPYLKEKYEVYTGTSDLFVYFFEKGLKLLKENCYFSFIVSNKFLKVGYGKELIQYLQKNYSLKELIDFGDTQIFEGATTYPCIIGIQKKKPEEKVKYKFLKITNKELLINLSNSLEINGSVIELDKDVLEWSTNSKDEKILIDRIKKETIPLIEFVNSKIFTGIKTAFNEAFIINDKTREKLISTNSKCEEIIKPYIRGKDIFTYYINNPKLWVICLEAGWTNKNRGDEEAEVYFKNNYPSVYNHLVEIQNRVDNQEIQVKGNGLYKRDDQGDYWWELRSCTYYSDFENDKIIYSEIANKGQFYLDYSSFYIDMTGFTIISDSKYLLSLLNSKLYSYLLKQISSEIRGGYLRWKKQYVKDLPIKTVIDIKERNKFDIKADIMINLNKELHRVSEKFISYITDKHNLSKVTGKISEFYLYDFNEFLKELKKQKIVLQGMEEYSLKEIFDNEKSKVMEIKSEIEKTDKEIDKMVYDLYELTAEEIKVVEESM